MVAVIMAGGKGTRIADLTKNDIPKPMIPIGGKPILLHQIDVLKRNGIKEYILVVGYKKEKIQSFFQDGRAFGVSISYIEETTPLGTAGALYYLKGKLQEDFLLVLGDVIFDIDINRMRNFHLQRKAIATLFGHPNSHPYDSDLIVLAENQRVKSLSFRNKDRGYYRNCVNAGMYILHPDALESLKQVSKVDLEKDLLMGLIVADKRVFAYVSTEYIKDVGTAERLQKTEQDLKNGIVAMRNLKNKQRALFLDRDGTINTYAGLIYTTEQLAVMENSYEAIAKINSSGYLCIVVTNQPVVARGLCTVQELEEINNKLETKLGEKGCFLDDLVYCPHHPDSGYPEENPAYKIVCNCRKPKVGLIKKCVEKYNIDIENSWFIGDTTVDVKTGVNAGLKTALVQTGMAGKDGKFSVNPDLVAKDLLLAVDNIIQGDT